MLLLNLSATISKAYNSVSEKLEIASRLYNLPLLLIAIHSEPVEVARSINSKVYD